MLLIGLNLLNYIDRYILPGAQPLIQREYGWNDQQMGALTTALFVTYMLVAPLTGWLGDRFPPQAAHHRRRGVVEPGHAGNCLGPRLLDPLFPACAGWRR